MNVYFQNRQWRVTDLGLECQEPEYLINKEVLADRLEEQVTVNWHLILHGRSWVDFDAFCEAYRESVRVHAVDISEADVALSERVACRTHVRPL